MKIEDDNYNFDFGIHGVGFDIGFVYTLKSKDNAALIGNKAPKKSKANPDYLFRVGLGINDIGKLSYQSSEYARTIQGNNRDVDLSNITNSDSSFNNFEAFLDSVL